MIVIKCPSTVASGSSAWNPGFVDGRHDEGSHEPIPPIWTRSSCRHRWRPLIHTIQPLPLSRCRCNAICVDIHLNWRMERCPSHCEQYAQHSLLLRTTSRYITKKQKMELYSKKRMQISVASGYITKKTKKELYLFRNKNANFCRKTRKSIFLEFFWNSSRLEFQKN